MADFVKKCMEGYEESTKQLQVDADIMKEKYYSNERFLQTLEKL